MNDVCDIIVRNTTCKLYADDIDLLASVDFNDVSQVLQVSLDNLIMWSNTWQLKVNSNKWNVLCIGRNCVSGDYTNNGDVFPSCRSGSGPRYSGQ